MLLNNNDPIAPGQIVKHPKFKTENVIFQTKKDSTEALIETYGWIDIALWDRREATPAELAIKLHQARDVIENHYKDREKEKQENADLREKNARLQRKETLLIEETAKREKAEAELAELTITSGKLENDYKRQIADLEKELGKLRNQALKNEQDEQFLETLKEEKEQLAKKSADYHAKWKREEKRASEMMNAQTRINHQKTSMQFITISDNVDIAPKDAEIAAYLSEGWQIQNISLKPTWLYDEKGTTRDVSHTIRYIALTRSAPIGTDDEDEESVKLSPGMDEAIEQALGKNDGSHIMALTAPIGEIANRGFATDGMQTAISNHGIGTTKEALNALIHQAGLQAMENKS